ncbi:5-keto-4-deoxy-D-glucarate aldolase-like protein [Cladobotryum mycophilum]|uniref:5-keto-4-deoxy-D-glucarate aldolase-like protein n=1 Tax=Cladobotryum mycophilum TaxID=491253 RepID=A0ABR0SQB8_9HYPO
MAANNVKGMQAYAAPSLFQPHRARDAIRDAHKGKIPPLLGYYAGLSSIPITRFLAPLKYDMVWIDWEHTACDVETMTTMVHETIFMSQGATIPFVRLPSNDHTWTTWALDAGASIVFPQMETVEQAKHAVAGTRFGAKRGGARSAPPFRYLPTITDIPYEAGRDFHQCLNDQAAIMIQIESLKGVENLDAILTEVPEIDIVWIGNLDLRISMGLPGNGGMGGDEPEYNEAKKKVFKVLDKHDKPYGGFAFGTAPLGTPEALKKNSERMALCVVSADVMHLTNMAQDLHVARQTLALDTDQEDGDATAS